MFCTTLRRRPSVAQAIPKLTGAENLGLRESQLSTHDLAIPIAADVVPRTTSTVARRQLRVLLLSPSATNDDKLLETVERIRRLASLTGGQDLAIVLLLEVPADAKVASATAIGQNETSQCLGEAGVIAYGKLQATIMDHAEIPHTPILPLAKLDGLTDLLRKHVAYLARPKRKSKPATTPFALLQLCTANPPMSQQTAYILSDLFPNLRELAAACTATSRAPNSSSPWARAAGFSSQATGTQGSGLGMSTQYSDDRMVDKLKRLRDLVGEQEYADIVDFWKEEWTID